MKSTQTQRYVFARLRLLRHALPIYLLILRKKTTVLQSNLYLERLDLYRKDFVSK